MIELFKIYDCGLPKKRYGNQYDGGYVIADGLTYDCCISGGAGGNITCEKDFAAVHGLMIVYDATVTYDRIKNINVIGKNIGAMNTWGTTNIHDWLGKHKNVFIKFDIEGAEFAWLDALPHVLQKNIKQMVIEFHGAEQSVKYIQQLQQTHSLIHVHGNNYSPTVRIDGHEFPNVYEATFVRSADFDIQLSANKYPCPLDSPNNPYKNEIDLSYL